MKKYSLYISLLMLLFAVSSCQDFLDRPPYDSIPDTEYWQNEEHIRTYAYGFYPTFFVGYGTSGLISGSLFETGIHSTMTLHGMCRVNLLLSGFRTQTVDGVLRLFVKLITCWK